MTEQSEKSNFPLTYIPCCQPISPQYFGSFQPATYSVSTLLPKGAPHATDMILTVIALWGEKVLICTDIARFESNERKM